MRPPKVETRVTRSLSNDDDFMHVNAYLTSVRLLSMRSILERLRLVCPYMSVERCARSVGIVLRLCLNCALGVWFATGRARVLAFLETFYFLWRLYQIGRNVKALRSPNMLESQWDAAAEGIRALRPLANYSLLGQLPRVRHVAPGVWEVFCREAESIKACNGSTLIKVRLWFLATFRMHAFALKELIPAILGLVSLHQKTIEVQSAKVVASPELLSLFIAMLRRWVPLIGFANQITGVVDQEELCMDAVLQTIFAGVPAISQPEKIFEFNGVLLRALCQKYGRWYGTLLYLSFNSEDYRRLVVAVRND